LRGLNSFSHFIGRKEAIPMKTKLLHTLASVFLNALVALGIGAIIAGPVFATTQTITPLTIKNPRVLQEQATHYIRFTVNYNQCPLRTADTACSFRVAALPYNAFLVAISKQIITTFNPTTSATIALGTTGQGTDIMAAFNVFTGQATTAVYDTGFAAAGEAVTGNGATPTGTNGAFDVYATYTVGAAGSQGTQGQVIFIIQYIAPNDGGCSAVAAGATATAC
jgi:hypothetical protein